MWVCLIYVYMMEVEDRLLLICEHRQFSLGKEKFASTVGCCERCVYSREGRGGGGGYFLPFFFF